MNIQMKIDSCIISMVTFWALVGAIQAQPSDWRSVGIGGGGALFSPSISPHNEQEIFIACDMTNLFHTTTAGKDWEILPFTEIRAFPETHVQFTTDPDILFALHYDFISDRKVPAKSSDGGLTWSALPEDPTDGESYYLFADPGSTTRLIVSSYDQIYFSDDGGQSFKSIYSNDQNEGAYIGGTFWDGANIFIAVGRGILVSSDNGASFDLKSFPGIPASEGIISFSAGKQNNLTRFYAVTLNLDDIYPTVSGAEHWGYQGCYALDYNAAPTWTGVTDGLSSADHPYFIRASASNPNIAYLAGGNGDTFYPIVFKTTNGGVSWQEVFLAIDNQNITTGWSGYRGDTDWWYGEYALGFAISPTDPDVVLFTDLGYAHITTDGGESWQQQYVHESTQNPAGVATPMGKAYQSIGLENTSCWWLTWLDQENIFASFTDVTAIRSKDGGNSWSRDYQNLDYNSTYQAIQHPESGILYAAVSNIHDIYQSTYLQDEDFDGGDGSIMYSNDGGASWQLLHDFNHPVVWAEFDPNDPNTMYASVVSHMEGGIYRTSNLNAKGASVWTRLSRPPRTEGHPFNIKVLNDGTLVTTYSGRRDNNGNFTGSSGVFVSDDGGMTWQDRSDNGMFYWTKDIAIDIHDEGQNTWYVSVFSGWGGAPNNQGGIYRTTDRGASWRRISDLDRVESCAIHPNDPQIMYVATEAEGLWYTDNLSAAPPTFRLLPEYPFQHPVRVFFDPFDESNVWVTSFGNGIRIGTVEGTSMSTQALSSIDHVNFEMFPNPTPGQFTLFFTTKRNTDLTIEILNPLGRVMQTVASKKLYTKGDHSISITLKKGHEGIHFVRFRNNGKQLAKKIILLK